VHSKPLSNKKNQIELDTTKSPRAGQEVQIEMDATKYPSAVQEAQISILQSASWMTGES
jgi:hypothetical protein